MQKIINFLEGQTQSHSPMVVADALSMLGIDPDPERVILVAGTNGKGTTAATLQTLLKASGKKVGFFSSPHLEKINERIKYNAEDISDEEFQRVFNILRDRIAHYNFSYFEYLTIIAAYYFFCVKNVDYAIFEVGLGGTLDATNAIPHAINVITAIGMDHEDILGKSLEQIARNKFGIVSSGSKVFHSHFSDARVKEITGEFSAEWIEADAYTCIVDTEGIYPRFFLDMHGERHEMSIPGERAAENMALAVTVFRSLEVKWRDYMHALSNVYWPGRMERIVYRGRDVFLSGDHNPLGICSLTNLLSFYNYGICNCVVGICQDKDHTSMLNILAKVRDIRIYLTETPVKTLSIDNYQHNANIYMANSDPIAAFSAAFSNTKQGDMILVSGSLYLVGLIRHHIMCYK